MKNIAILILITLPYWSNAQIFVGPKVDLMSYKLKSFRDPDLSNTGASYSAFVEIPFRKLIKIGIETGIYKFELDRNTSTNVFIKPTFIFNAQIGKNNISISPGISFDMSVKNQINSPYKDYYTYTDDDTLIYSERASFERAFSSLVIGFAYSRQISNKFDIGIKIETMGSLDGFYKKYTSSFNRYGLFVKYRISKNKAPAKF